ncbi:MAG TPA: hypothetical protein VJM33_10080 [Microthrixaceae bacterium]|nr:hypothetical protein [Microthrixaceae bacterium]
MTALAMVLSGSWLVVISPTGATDNGGHSGGPPGPKVTICHRTASHTNPYVKITVAQDAVDGDLANDHGQGDHFLEHLGAIGPLEVGEWGDIIPPIPGVHGGLNWGPVGQAIFARFCDDPDPTTTKKPHSTTTTASTTTAPPTTTTTITPPPPPPPTTTTTKKPYPTTTKKPHSTTTTTITPPPPPPPTTTTTTAVAPTTTTADSTFAFTAAPRCTLDAPWLDLQASAVGFTGNYTLHWLDAGGTERLIQQQPLGSSSTLFPGATINAQGTGTDWPGWILSNGEWIEAEDGFAWARQPGVRVFATINPTSATVMVAYPPSTPTCNAGPRTNVSGATAAQGSGSGGSPASTTESQRLGFTGGNPALGIGVGLALILAGGLLMGIERRRLARD